MGASGLNSCKINLYGLNRIKRLSFKCVHWHEQVAVSVFNKLRHYALFTFAKEAVFSSVSLLLDGWFVKRITRKLQNQFPQNLDNFWFVSVSGSQNIRLNSSLSLDMLNHPLLLKDDLQVHCVILGKTFQDFHDWINWITYSLQRTAQCYIYSLSLC